MKLTKNHNISITNYIKNVSKEDLASFIAYYSRKNGRFKLAVKARFSPDLKKDNKIDLYKKIADEIIRPGITLKKITLPNERDILFLLDEFFDHFNDSYAEKHYFEAYEIIGGILNSIVKLGRYQKTEKIEKSIFKAFELFDKLNDNDVPIDISYNLLNFLIDSIQDNAYYQNTYLDKYLDSYLLTSKRLGKKITPSNFFPQIFKDELIHDNTRLIFTVFLTKLGYNNQIPKLDTATLKSGVSLAIKHKLFALAYSFNQQLLDNKFIFKLKYFQNILEIAKKEENNDLIIKTEIEIFLITNKETILKKARTINPAIFTSAIKEILKNRRNTLSTEKQITLNIFIGKYSKALDLIIAGDSLDYLTLIKENKFLLDKDIQNRIISFIIDYLQNYHGPISIEKTRKVIYHFLGLHEIKLIRKIKLSIKQNFADRKTLLESI